MTLTNEDLNRLEETKSPAMLRGALSEAIAELREERKQNICQRLVIDDLKLRLAAGIPRWISCSERLPEASGNTFCANKEAQWIEHFMSRSWEGFRQPTHWIPLLPLPAEKEQP